MWEAFIKEFRSRRSKKEEMDPPQEYTGELSPEVQRYIRKLASRRDVSLTIL
ncbi:MAG: hypothetical protein QMC90_04385 [Dehalococcoidales bacterium]|nr:hypothetical protein [Dehalococcoidales bacterium]